MSDFIKNEGFIDGLSLSDVSEVDPNELEQILQSASELDKKYQIGESEGKTVNIKNPNKNQLKNTEDSQNSNLKENILEGDISRSFSLFQEATGPFGYDSKTDYPQARRIDKRSKNTADWLGLKDSPAKSELIDNIHERNISFSPEAGDYIKHIDKKSIEDNKSKEEIDPITVSPAPVPPPPTMKSRNRNKGILMTELFGDLNISNEEPVVKVGVGPPLTAESEKKSLDYTPSVATTRRNEKRIETSLASNTASGLDGDLDWLTGIKSSPAKETPRQNISDNMRPKTAAPPATSTPQPSKAPPSAGSKKESKESKIPDWLEELVKDSSQQKKELSVAEDNSKKLPDWLGSSSSNPQQEQPKVEEQHPPPMPVQVSSQEQAKEVDGNIMSKLASVQMELVAAMSKRTENLQVYMQELMHEAERVVSSNSTSPNSKISPVHSKNHVPDAIEKNREVNNELASNHLLEEVVHKDNLIHDLEIKVGRLELQNEHLEMKIQNMISTHEMEIESLKKSHGFEISAWETRLERLKKTFEETTAEYEEKIVKLKEKETLITAEHKDRIAKLEEERLADLSKLGDFHRLAMEQAASFTVVTPAINSSQMIRLPLRGQQRPKDEVELSERESALLEKERQIEVLKATLEAERKELDEALEMEKIRREEQARESRRQSTEVRLREEARQAEAKREREQLDALALQIKIMRDEALKEQGDIAKEKLELAAERARLEATYSIQGRTEGAIPPLDIMQARAEVEAALETARQAKEAAEMERRRQAEMRQAVEQITWEQKEMDLRLENRERHVNDMLKSAERLRNEGLSAIEEAKAMKQEMENQQREVKEQLNQIETKERVLAKERLEIAKEKIELERRKAQLEFILPELNPAEELTINPPKVFVDPKAVIMRLKAEKELESYMTTRK